MTRDTLLENIKNNLSEIFVNDFEKINEARDNVNKYLKEIDVDYIYEYNDFCVDFMDKSIKIVDLLSEEQLENLDGNLFVSDTISYMIKNKIFDVVKDASKRNNLIIQHELQKYLLNY